MKAGFAASPPAEENEETDRPILILGASRAGKSLVEHLLSDGRDVIGFGEHLTWQSALAAVGVTDVALRPLSSSSRSTSFRFSTLPVALRGSSSRNSTSRGVLYPARFSPL